MSSSGMLRLISVNAWDEPIDRTLRANLLLYTIKELEVDLVCLQEVSDYLWLRLDELEEWWGWRIGELAIMSRFPFAAQKVVALGKSKLQLVHIKNRMKVGADIRKINMVIGNFHMIREKTPDLDDHMQLQKLLAKTAKIKHSKILLAGDTNIRNANFGTYILDHGWISLLENQHSANKFRYMATIDRLLASQDLLADIDINFKTTMEDVYLSDHKALLLEFTLKN
jgi:endonuclease/exonuclease/phosphatase family metal-dependent hydrolase